MSTPASGQPAAASFAATRFDVLLPGVVMGDVGDERLDLVVADRAVGQGGRPVGGDVAHDLFDLVFGQAEWRAATPAAERGRAREHPRDSRRGASSGSSQEARWWSRRQVSRLPAVTPLSGAQFSGHSSLVQTLLPAEVKPRALRVSCRSPGNIAPRVVGRRFGCDARQRTAASRAANAAGSERGGPRDH